jgi:glycosyltransferase involved in cell wall biosynthesis
MNNNLISIVIPTYNRKKKLERAILSVLNQSYKNWELIIVDNYSTDNTEKLVKNFNSDKINFFQINNNGIIAKSRNFGISKSRGEYICFLDSDDFWHLDKLFHISKYINKGFNLIYHDMYLFNKKYFKKKTSYCRNLSHPIYKDLLYNGPAFPTSSVCVNKKIINTLGFDESSEFLAWEDYDAWLNISKITEKFIKVPKTLGFITVDNENFLNNEVAIKNIFSYQSKYFPNKNLPNWALLSLARSYLKKNDIANSKLYLRKIKFFELNFNLFLRTILFWIILNLRH